MPRPRNLAALPRLSEDARRPVISDEEPGLASALNAIVATGTSTTLRRRLMDVSGFPLPEDTPSFLLFNQLIYRGAARPSDMADAIDVSNSYISRIVKRMEVAGLITRAPDPGDDRAVIIGLTDNGRKIAQRVVEAGEDLFSSVIEEWSPDELETLEVLLIKLARSMNSASSRLVARVSGERWLTDSDE